MGPPLMTCAIRKQDGGEGETQLIAANPNHEISVYSQWLNPKVLKSKELGSKKPKR